MREPCTVDELRGQGGKSGRVRWRRRRRKAGADETNGESEKTRTIHGTTGSDRMLDKQERSSRHGCEGGKQEENALDRIPPTQSTTKLDGEMDAVGHWTGHEASCVSSIPFSMDCSPFLNWREDENETFREKAVVFWSLIATLKFQPALDEYLEAKALKFLESVRPKGTDSTAAFLGNLASICGDSSIQAITTASMKKLDSLISWCSTKHHLTLIQADLIAQLIDTLNPQSLSFSEAVNVHTTLSRIIAFSLWLATTDGLTKLETKDDDEDQAVHETVLKQVLSPSEKNRLEPAIVSNRIQLLLDSKHCLTIRILPCQSPSIVAALSFSFAATLAQLLYQDNTSINRCNVTIGGEVNEERESGEMTGMTRKHRTPKTNQLEVTGWWTSRTDAQDVDVREGRKKSEKVKRDVKRRKCTSALPLISPRESGQQTKLGVAFCRSRRQSTN
ncbi:hypothetical protein BLNAU_14604 [Blattamonas nauphoetae]|uniref:Uncharacterized protein n=1 Tax=Blattamonas nauphoetae TaxID=2049346 RepID=A0ABQ9XJQ6_9EUKA|nr:hypothetical protein BLNAU_14604 [Blattamonas nauphoetae]